jgi:hypothetical protein
LGSGDSSSFEGRDGSSGITRRSRFFQHAETLGLVHKSAEKDTAKGPVPQFQPVVMRPSCKVSPQRHSAE